MLLNNEHAKKIFKKYSFLAGSVDVMSAIKATDIFGKDAIIYAIRAHTEGIKTVVMHDFGNGIQYVYLTYAGIQQAATYLNMQKLEADVKDAEWHEIKERNKIISFNARRKKACMN